jgi:RNA polymerase sigma factor (sigma-70 family)
MLNPSLLARISSDYAGLLSLFKRRLNDEDLAEDLIQQAFVESLEKLAARQIADPGCFCGFVHGVARNLLRNHVRRMDNRRDARVANAVLDHLACDASPHEQHHRVGMAREVRRAIAELRVARDREVVRRLYLYDQSKDVICRDMGLLPSDVDKVAFRARRRMKRVLEARGIERCDCFTGGRDDASESR